MTTVTTRFRSLQEPCPGTEVENEARLQTNNLILRYNSWLLRLTTARLTGVDPEDLLKRAAKLLGSLFKGTQTYCLEGGGHLDELNGMIASIEALLRESADETYFVPSPSKSDDLLKNWARIKGSPSES